MRRRVSVQGDFFWHALALYCFLEKALCGCDIPVLAQKKVDCVALLIYSTIEILPFASNADVCLVNSPGCANWTGEATPLLLEFRDIVLYPSEDGCMSEIDAAFSHHVAEVTRAKLVGNIPTYA